jgi:hypothetical protein
MNAWRSTGIFSASWRLGVNEKGDPLELVETKYMYCICVLPNEDGSFPGQYGEVFAALVPFESTKIKAFDAWVERNKTFRYLLPRPGGVPVKKEIAMWSHVWRLQTALKQRGNQTWFIWTLSLAAKNDDGTEKHYTESRIGRKDPLYIEAENFRTQALEGNADIDFERDTSDATTGDGATGGAGDAQVNDEIPFGQNA